MFSHLIQLRRRDPAETLLKWLSVWILEDNFVLSGVGMPMSLFSNEKMPWYSFNRLRACSACSSGHASRPDKSNFSRSRSCFSISESVGCSFFCSAEKRLVTLDERSHNLDRFFRNIYIVPSFPTREQHAHSVQNARSRFNKLNQSYSC